MMKLTAPAIAAIVALVVTLLAVPATAAAQSRAVARSVVATSTATWGAVAAAVGASATVGMGVETTVTKRIDTAYFDVVNVGNLPLAGQVLTVSTVSFTGSENPRLEETSAELVACVGGMWGPKRCSGTEVELDQRGEFEFTSKVSINPGKRVTVRLTDDPGKKETRTITVDVSVSRTHVRESVTTHT